MRAGAIVGFDRGWQTRFKRPQVASACYAFELKVKNASADAEESP
jgi:hypothetical protein